MKKQTVAAVLAVALCYSSAASADLIGTLLVNLAAKVFIDDSSDSKASAESGKQAADDSAESGRVEPSVEGRLPDSSTDKAD